MNSDRVTVTVRLSGEDYEAWCRHAGDATDLAEFLQELFHNAVLKGCAASAPRAAQPSLVAGPPSLRRGENFLAEQHVERLRLAGYRILPGSVSKEPFALNRARTCFWCDALGIPKRDRWMWQARMADFVDLNSGSNFAVRRCICEHHAQLVLGSEEKNEESHAAH